MDSTALHDTQRHQRLQRWWGRRACSALHHREQHRLQRARGEDTAAEADMKLAMSGGVMNVFIVMMLTCRR